jgi:uncharacterized SAM-dependent methyltransferase
MAKRKRDNHAILKARALQILRKAKRVVIVEWFYDRKGEELRVRIAR